MNRRRNPKKPNLSGLKVVDYSKAYDGKKLKKEVYGIVSRDHSFIFKKITDQNGRLEKRSIYAFCRVFADKSQHRRRTTFESTN